MNDLKFKDLKGKVVICCKTEQEAKDCCDFMASIGLKWSDGTSYKEATCYNIFKDKICYNFKDGVCSGEASYKASGYRIFEWADVANCFKREILK